MLEVLKDAERYKSWAGDAERAEYFVRVQWLDTRKEANAISELGLFGNQNTV